MCKSMEINGILVDGILINGILINGILIDGILIKVISPSVNVMNGKRTFHNLCKVRMLRWKLKK